MTAVQQNNWQTSFRFRIPSPLGTAWIIIVEESPGKIDNIFFTIGKAGTPVNAMCDGMARLAVRALKNGDTIGDVIATLSGITSDRVINANGREISSPTESLVLALFRYRAGIKSHTRDGLGQHLKRVR